MTVRKKLIEVALPLEAINKESAREKSIRHGHPSTLHLWWARRPLAACRAVLFASLVDDPSSLPEQFPTEADQDKERQRLFRLIEKLVLWENLNNRAVLDEAHAEILKSTGGHPPPVYDPFCGGGSIPLEAQRLGLEAHASDLNPVAVLITKALIEIPPKFAGQPPTNPAAKKRMSGKGMWTGASGLADDVRYYGQWMRDRAFERIGHLYPKVKMPNGDEATVIAWLWARTVLCPNPACGARMPLVRSFALSTKSGKKAWVEPVIDHTAKSVRFKVKTGDGIAPEGIVSRRGARCLVCGNTASLDEVRKEGREGRMSAQMLAIVAEASRGRVYVPADSEHIRIAESVEPVWSPETNLSTHPQYMGTPRYGLTKHADLFTRRQLMAMGTVTQLVDEARKQAQIDGAASGYADAIATYLGLAASRLSDSSNTGCKWSPPMDQSTHLFVRQAIQMTWDFSEANLFSGGAGDYGVTVSTVARAIETLPAGVLGKAVQLDAAARSDVRRALTSTDPPYYDNVPYADLSDFFYIWLRRGLGNIYPELFSTLLVPKAAELVADVQRLGGVDKARAFFESGFAAFCGSIYQAHIGDYPLTIYYAFKQIESDDDDGDLTEGIASTGWEA